MRDILYRAKALYGGEWLYGSIVIAKDTGCSGPFCMLIPSSAEHMGGPEFNEGYQIGSETVGQYTGLKDRDGQRIFEGDIVKAVSHSYMGDMFHGAVVFKDGCFGIEYFIKGFSDKLFHRIGEVEQWQDMNSGGTITYTYEVIGNIHDHPEKLEI